VHEAGSVSVGLVVMAPREFGVIAADKGGFSTVVTIRTENDLRREKRKLIVSPTELIPGQVIRLTSNWLWSSESLIDSPWLSDPTRLA